MKKLGIVLVVILFCSCSSTHLPHCGKGGCNATKGMSGY